MKNSILETPATLLKRKAIAIKICTALLILLWTYTAISKLIDLEVFRSSLFNQTFSKSTAKLLLYVIPISELLAVGLLLLKKTNGIGLAFSAALLMVFTGYIILILIGFYDKIPCSCGGVLAALGWRAHLIFNLCFLLLSIIALKLQIQQRNIKRSILIYKKDQF